MEWSTKRTFQEREMSTSTIPRVMLSTLDRETGCGTSHGNPSKSVKEEEEEEKEKPSASSLKAWKRNTVHCFSCCIIVL
ncbi:hypothetical protein COCNU_10G002080 [Cocos nucifera]|uniref:Uncharacterized protein n=1 Tax=Cocos nucifera TaxID=13894 RepID=A0A8K0N8J5_COCNU|nr:hypothetical protein COCNU_10G002080 [Cocos nucifera]